MAPETREQFEEVCRDVCPSCAKGIKLRQRTDTGEYVHDSYERGSFGHAFCLAHNYRLKYGNLFDG